MQDVEDLAKVAGFFPPFEVHNEPDAGAGRSRELRLSYAETFSS